MPGFARPQRYQLRDLVRPIPDRYRPFENRLQNFTAEDRHGRSLGGNLALKPGSGYGWAPVPGTANVYDWLSDSFTLPKGAPHRDAAVKWLTFLGSRLAQDTFNPVKGSIPARKDANTKLYGAYLKTALKDWKGDALAGSLAHGVVASNAWNADIDTALGLFLQSKNVARFQTALVAAAKKNAK